MPKLRSLYLCYLSLEDPLVHTQVVAYLTGLAADGHHIHLLTFEPGGQTRRRRRELRAGLAVRGITWHRLRYHKTPSLPATFYDTLAGALYATVLVRRHQLNALHARSHVPAAMAMVARGLLRRRRTGLIFDIRGLMAEEYVDAGRWRAEGVAFRLTKAVERAAIRRADGIVVLTERVRRQTFDSRPAGSVYTIPCCADVEALAAAADARDGRREKLGLANSIVMVYVGKFGERYMAAEMADFFLLAQRRMPALHFLVLTQGAGEQIQQQFERRGAKDGYTITAVPPDQIGGYLASADFGIAFIHPRPSEVAASPTKVGEYLGAGLPVVCSAGIGDLDRLIVPDVGTLVGEHTESSYEFAIDHMTGLLERDGTRQRCLAVATRELSLSGVGIPRYLNCYEEIARRL
jgi:glycosyltransferase involved in cell wall biosynthesis